MNNNNEQCEYNRTIGTSTQINAFIATLALIEVGLSIVVKAVYARALLS